MTEIKRKRGETFESFLRRFKQRLQLSGRILQAKKIRFHQRSASKTAQKKAALRRLELEEHYEKLRKLGKLPEERKTRKRY